ncbi:MAG: hypothetical protein ABI591_09695 [Kofleriaceae bacterium]
MSRAVQTRKRAEKQARWIYDQLKDDREALKVVLAYVKLLAGYKRAK